MYTEHIHYVYDCLSMNIFDENTHLGGPQKKKTWSL